LPLPDDQRPKESASCRKKKKKKKKKENKRKGRERKGKEHDERTGGTHDNTELPRLKKILQTSKKIKEKYSSRAVKSSNWKSIDVLGGTEVKKT